MRVCSVARWTLECHHGHVDVIITIIAINYGTSVSNLMKHLGPIEMRWGGEKSILSIARCLCYTIEPLRAYGVNSLCSRSCIKQCMEHLWCSCLWSKPYINLFCRFKLFFYFYHKLKIRNILQLCPLHNHCRYLPIDTEGSATRLDVSTEMPDCHSLHVDMIKPS